MTLAKYYSIQQSSLHLAGVLVASAHVIVAIKLPCSWSIRAFEASGHVVLIIAEDISAVALGTAMIIFGDGYGLLGTQSWFCLQIDFRPPSIRSNVSVQLQRICFLTCRAYTAGVIWLPRAPLLQDRLCMPFPG